MLGEFEDTVIILAYSFMFIYLFYFELNMANKQARTQGPGLVPWHLVANGTLFVELCRGRSCGTQSGRRRIRLICRTAALGLKHRGTFPLPCVVHAPNTHTAIIASRDEHGGQHVPADSPHGAVMLAELQCLQI